MNFQYYLFDFDGCLVDSFPIWLEAWKRVFADYGMEVEEAEIITRCFGKNEDSLLGFGIKENREFYQKVLDLAHSTQQNMQLFPGVLSSLKVLERAGKKTAIVSSSTREIVMDFLKREGLTHLIDDIVSANEVQNLKPDPEPVLKAVRNLGANPAMTVMVGDSASDILAGKNAGLKTILYKLDMTKYSEHVQTSLNANPDFIVEDFMEILGI